MDLFYINRIPAEYNRTHLVDPQKDDQCVRQYSTKNIDIDIKYNVIFAAHTRHTY